MVFGVVQARRDEDDRVDEQVDVHRAGLPELSNTNEKNDVLTVVRIAHRRTTTCGRRHDASRQKPQLELGLAL